MMQLRKIFKTLIFVGITGFTITSHASDTAKEKRWADQIVDSIMVGDAEWIKAGKDKILSIYTEHTTEKASGAAIVLHGIGVHPNWDQIIRPVRSQLPDHGWATLSLQLPILPNEAESEDYKPLFKEVPARIKAGVDFLKSKGINNIVIIAHSLGSSMSAYYLARNPDPAVRGFVAIGTSGNLLDNEDEDFIKSVTKVNIPVLDIYGSNDLKTVLNSIKDRATGARKAGNKNYTQVEIPGANHFFDNKNDILIKRIRGWLKKNVQGTEINVK